MLSVEKINEIKAEARQDAELFYEEFQEALDPSETDWDGTAFANLRVRLEEIEKGPAWPVYQRELIAATQYLADGHELLITKPGSDHNLT